MDLGACEDDPCWLHEDGICLSALPNLRKVMQRNGIPPLSRADVVAP